MIYVVNKIIAEMSICRRVPKYWRYFHYCCKIYLVFSQFPTAFRIMSSPSRALIRKGALPINQDFELTQTWWSDNGNRRVLTKYYLVTPCNSTSAPQHRRGNVTSPTARELVVSSQDFLKGIFCLSESLKASNTT